MNLVYTYQDIREKYTHRFTRVHVLSHIQEHISNALNSYRYRRIFNQESIDDITLSLQDNLDRFIRYKTIVDYEVDINEENRTVTMILTMPFILDRVVIKISIP